MPTKKPLSLLGISRRTIPSVDEILRGFTQRVAKKKGGKTQHRSISPWHSGRQEKKEGSMATHVILSYIYIYTHTYIYVYFLNKTKLIRVPVTVAVRREISPQNCKDKFQIYWTVTIS